MLHRSDKSINSLRQGHEGNEMKMQKSVINDGTKLGDD